MNDCYYNRILEDDLTFKLKTRKKVILLLGREGVLFHLIENSALIS